MVLPIPPPPNAIAIAWHLNRIAIRTYILCYRLLLDIIAFYAIPICEHFKPHTKQSQSIETALASYTLINRKLVIVIAKSLIKHLNA